MYEVHHDPDHASSDGAQSLSIPQFKEITRNINKLIGRIDYDNRTQIRQNKQKQLKQTNKETKMALIFQELILNLSKYWSDYGCIIQQPYDIEKS